MFCSRVELIKGGFFGNLQLESSGLTGEDVPLFYPYFQWKSGKLSLLSPQAPQSG